VFVKICCQLKTHMLRWSQRSEMKVRFEDMHDDGTKVKAFVANVNVTKVRDGLFRRQSWTVSSISLWFRIYGDDRNIWWRLNHPIPSSSTAVSGQKVYRWRWDQTAANYRPAGSQWSPKNRTNACVAMRQENSFNVYKSRLVTTFFWLGERKMSTEKVLFQLSHVIVPEAVAHRSGVNL
jgi:hypothetical protein